MFEEHVAHDFTKSNLELLCDIKVFLGLACIIPMLECVQSLSKFAQAHDVFICDFVATLKSWAWIYIACIAMSKLSQD